MADNEIDVKIVAQTGDLKPGLNDAASAVDNAAQHMKSSLGGASETIVQKLKDLQVGLNSATGGITGALGEITESFAGFFGGLVVLEVGKQIVETFERIGEAIAGVAENGDQLLKTGQKTGIAVEELSQLKYAASLADVGFEELQTSLVRLSVNMEKASHGTGEAAGAFQALGIHVTDAQGHLKPLGDVMKELADKFSGLEDGPAKAALAIAIFGRAGAALIPLLDQGGASLQAMTDEANRFGVSISGPAAEASEKFNDNLKRIGDAAYGLWQTFVERLIPVLSDLFDQFANIIGNSPGIKAAIDAIGAAFSGVLLVIDGVVVGLRTIFDMLSITYHAVFDSLGAIVTLTRDIVTGNLDALKADFNAASDGMTKHFVANLADMKSAYDSFAKTVGKVFGTEQPEEKAPKKPAPLIPDLAAAGAAAKKARDEDAADLKASLKEEMDQIRATNLAEIAMTRAKGLAEVQIKQQNLETQKSLNQISADDEETIARNLMVTKYNIELQAMQQEAGLRSTDQARKVQLAAQEAILYSKLQADINRIHNQALQARAVADKKAETQSAQMWQGLISPVRNAFQQITNGVLQGTQTWSQAWRNAATSMVVSLANAGEQVLENMAINLAKGLLLQKTAGKESIFIEAKKAFSGAYSSASAIPYIGWILGPIAGAAAFAAVAAQASFAVGTGNVPGDMTAQIHKGEIIVPATMSDSIRSGQLTLGGPAGGGSGSGGGPVHVNMGGVTINSAGENYDARKLLQIIHRGLRDNPSMKLGIA
jgi:hypothetical protein